MHQTGCQVERKLQRGNRENEAAKDDKMAGYFIVTQSVTTLCLMSVVTTNDSETEIKYA